MSGFDQSIAVPPHVAQMLLSQQRQQQQPTWAEQRKINAVQLAINSFGVDSNKEELTDDSLLRRARAIDKMIIEADETDEPATGETNQDAESWGASGLVSP